MKTLILILCVLFILVFGSCTDELSVTKYNGSSGMYLTQTTAIISIVVMEIGESVTESGICISKHVNPTKSDLTIIKNFIFPGVYQFGLSGLTPDTKYYIRAFTESSGKIFYSDTFSIQTLRAEWFTDTRDGQKYMVRNFGNSVWMIENLNYRTKNSVYFKNDSIKYASEFGRLYSFSDASIACPEGWHLPSEIEWENLLKVITPNEESAYYAMLEPGTRLWEVDADDLKITNQSGFTIRPSGIMEIKDKSPWFSQAGNMATFWFKPVDKNLKGVKIYNLTTIPPLSFKSDIGIDNIACAIRCIKNN